MRLFFWCLMIVVLHEACGDADVRVYTTLMKKELSRGHRVDSLFLGMYLGMTPKKFYGYCWEMNKKGLFTDGLNNTAVMYHLDHELAYPAIMNFYPDFYKDKLYKMRAVFQYNGWAPWNKKLFADHLLPDVLQLYKKWYPTGNPFITMHDPRRGTIYIKIDGNRRIIIGKSDDMQVKADYTDLLTAQQINNK
jgi:hypothetical protein